MADFDAALLSPSLGPQLRGEVHLDRGRAQVALGNVPAARTEIDHALQLVPGDPFAWYLSAALARRENNLARAGTDIARARQLAPDSPEIMLLAGTIAGLAGNMAEAESLYRQVNATAVGQLIEAAEKSGVRRVVHCSTVGVHGDIEHPPANEDAPLRPDSKAAYSATKAIAEQVVRNANGNGFETVVVRPRLVWGPGDTTILPALVKAVEPANTVDEGGVRGDH